MLWFFTVVTQETSRLIISEIIADNLFVVTEVQQWRERKWLQLGVGGGVFDWTLETQHSAGGGGLWVERLHIVCTQVVCQRVSGSLFTILQQLNGAIHVHYHESSHAKLKYIWNINPSSSVSTLFCRSNVFLQVELLSEIIQAAQWRCEELWSSER